MDFYINNKIIQLDKKTLPLDEPLVSYNKGYEANFIFDEEWNGLLKTVRFINGDKHKDVILEDDKCEFPIDIMGSVVEVGIFAGDLKSTNASYVLFLPSILEKFGVPVDPTPDVYLQIMRMIEGIKDEAVSDEEIQEAVDNYLEDVAIDSKPTEDSKNLVSSGGVYESIEQVKEESSVKELTNLEIEELLQNFV